MVFSSPVFIFLFLPIVLFCFAIAGLRFQNSILLIASLIFYAWGGVSHSIIFISSILINYSFGLLISNANENKAKWILGIGATINLLLLFYFKYFNFLLENFNAVFTSTGIKNIEIANIALPIGISFFTFHALSYLIDVYRKKVSAQRNIIDMALYMAFFPQLIAGPIVRYIDVADQFSNRVLGIGKATAGLQRFVFGLAKKVIVANTMAFLADQIFDIPTEQISSGLAWLGIVAYSLQIYFDFSGYSDMAIGLAQVFGFHFPENFNYPYVAHSIKEFWKRWHISLSTWFKDFLYIPLGGNKKGEVRTVINLLIVFFCTGFWHGASWTFVVWGLFHGVFLLIEKFGADKILSKVWTPLRVGYTLIVVMIGWVFFRADTISFAWNYIKRMFFIPSGTELQIVNMSEYLDAKVVFILLIAILYSFRFFRWLSVIFENVFLANDKQREYLMFFQSGKFLLSVSFLFITLVYLASSTYNPFIYFRF